MVLGNHPEMDNSPTLSDADHQNTRCSLKRPNWRIRIDLHDPIVVKDGTEGLLGIDVAGKLKEQYPEAWKSVDKK
eukprot:1527431-Ditylum_brightwellii.AAC.1